MSILWDLMACSPPGSSVLAILQASLLEWVALPFSRDSSWPKDQTQFPALQVDCLPSEPLGKPKFYLQKCNMCEIDMFVKFSCISSFYEALVTVKKWDCWLKNIDHHWEEKWNQILINVLGNSYCLKYQSKFFHWSCRIWNKHTKICCCLVAGLCPTLATPWTVAWQVSRSMGFSRWEYWSVLPFPTLGDLPDSGIEPAAPALAGEFFTTEPQQKPILKLETIYLKYHVL